MVCLFSRTGRDQHGGQINYRRRADEGDIHPARRAAMTMQEGFWGFGVGTAGRQLHDQAYFLDLLGDSHNGLGRYKEAIEAYRQAAPGFRAEGAQCSYALCLFKIADSYLSLGEPWHAIGDRKSTRLNSSHGY